MPAFTTVLSIAAVAGALVQAAPITERGAPKDYYVPYLEPYDTYHLRYLALDCQDKHNTTFFEQCCRPMLSTQTLADRPEYCTPNATEIASASSYIASTSQFGAPTSTASPAAVTSASASTTSSVDYESSAISVAEASYTDAPTTQAALAPVPTTTSSTSTWVAPTTTSSSSQAAPTTTQSSGNNNGNSGTQTGGYATYFYQNGNPGACGNYNSDSTPLVAIDQAWWPNFGVVSPLCGKYVSITNTANGKSVTAVIADVCPTCSNGNSLDLSVGAFTAIASESEGMVPISWSFV